MDTISESTYNVFMNRQTQEIQLQEGEIIEITPDMIIADVLHVYPEIKDVFDDVGIHCASCYAAMRDSIQEGALLHNIDPKILCRKINHAIKQHRKK